MSTKGISLGSLQLHEKKQTPVQNKTNKPASWDPFRWSVTKLCTTNAQDSKVKNFFGKVLATITTIGLSCTIVGVPLLGRAYVIMKEEQAFESGKTEGKKTAKKNKGGSKSSDKSSSKSSKKHKKEIANLKAKNEQLNDKNRELNNQLTSFLNYDFEAAANRHLANNTKAREDDYIQNRISLAIKNTFNAGYNQGQQHLQNQYNNNAQNYNNANQNLLNNNTNNYNNLINNQNQHNNNTNNYDNLIKNQNPSQNLLNNNNSGWWTSNINQNNNTDIFNNNDPNATLQPFDNSNLSPPPSDGSST